MFCSVCRPFSLLLLASGSCALTSHLLIYFTFSRWCKHTNNNRPCNHFGLFMLILCSVLLLLDWCKTKSICIHTDIRTMFSHWLKEWEKDVENGEKKTKKQKDQQPNNRWRKLKILWIHSTYKHTSIWRMYDRRNTLRMSYYYYYSLLMLTLVIVFSLY